MAMNDPLSISSGLNIGEAQVLDNRSYDMYKDYAAKQQSQAAAKRKSNTDIIKGIEDIRLGGFAGHQKDLLEKKNQLYDKLREGFVKNGFEWTPTADVNIARTTNELKDKVQFSQSIEKQFAADHNDIVSKKDTWTPESMAEVEQFYAMPLDKQYEYVNAHNSFPVLKPKEKIVDYTSFIQKTETPYNTLQVEVGKDEEGRIQYRNTKELDVQAVASQAQDAYDAAVNGRSTEYGAMLADVKKDVDANPNTSHLSPEKKDAIAQQNFVKKFVKIKEGTISTKDVRGSKSAGGGFNLSFGNGTASTDKYNFAKQDTKEEVNPAQTQVGGESVRRNIPTISVKRKPGVDPTKSTFIEDGKEIDVEVSSFQKYADGWYVVGKTTRMVKDKKYPYEEKKVTEDVKIPVKDNEAYIETQFGAQPEQLIEGMSGKKENRSGNTPKTAESNETGGSLKDKYKRK